MKYYFKKYYTTLLIVMILSSSFLQGCNTSSNNENNSQNSNTTNITVTDSLGNTAVLNKNSKVIAAYGSFAESWILSGGTLIGVTDDAIDERNLSLPSETQIIGSVKSPDIEKIISLNPDYVILSANLTAHLSIEETLKQTGIQYGYFNEETFNDYSSMMTQFCNVNERPDLLQKNVTDVKTQIDAVKNEVKNKYSSENAPSVLIIRAYSTGIKAKGTDTVAGAILNEFGCKNIIDDNPSMLDSLSPEEIINKNPDYIFVLTMGDENNALNYLEKNVFSNPAWNNLSAIKNNHYTILPKNLFHYKPNNRWGESYEYLKKILFS